MKKPYPALETPTNSVFKEVGRSHFLETGYLGKVSDSNASGPPRRTNETV